ncbi:MAG: EAL domain-containing protein [Planctomycetota bacterium]|nr:MAG: EAL domain-containing protein [Planctomycetota bacterium]
MKGRAMSEIRPAQILRALDAGEFEFFHQPKVSFLTGRVSGCEALLRWRRPDGSLLLPGDFLPQAESCGLVTEIARRMFPLLCREQAAFAAVREDLRVSFNVNPNDLENEELVELVLEGVAGGLLLPNQVQVELAGSDCRYGSLTLQANLELLAGSGVQLVMDDFGAGAASLEALNRLPFSAVKIDRRVVGGLLADDRCAALALAAIRAAHELDLTVIAQGVESEEEFHFLHHAGCSEAQGYWISPPLPFEEALEFAGADRRWCDFPVGLLRQIELDHIQWRKAVIDRVVGVRNRRLPAGSRRFGTDPQECRFGRWFYGEEQGFASDPGFAGLEEPHRNLHRAADRLLAAAEQENTAPAAIERMVAELQERSEEFLRALQALERQALLSGAAGGREGRVA